MKKKHITSSAVETRKLGKELARDILKRKAAHKTDGALVLALRGDLGGGKTTFLQGFAEGLGIKEKILSPTFVIMKKFKIPSRNSAASSYQNFYHLDCYRMKSEKDVTALGLEEVISNSKNIITVEWAERIKKILPQNALDLNFELKDENKRVVFFHRTMI